MPRNAVSRTANVGTWLRKRNGGKKWVKIRCYTLFRVLLELKNVVAVRRTKLRFEEWNYYLRNKAMVGGTKTKLWLKELSYCSRNEAMVLRNEANV